MEKKNVKRKGKYESRDGEEAWYCAWYRGALASLVLLLSTRAGLTMGEPAPQLPEDEIEALSKALSTT